MFRLAVRPPRRSLPLLTAVALLGCGSDHATAPADLGGAPSAVTFSQYSIDDRLLPLVESVTGACTSIDFGGRVSLYPDGTYAWVGESRRTLCGGAFLANVGDKRYGRYKAAGTQIEFTPDPSTSTPAMPPFVAAFSPARGDFAHGGALGTLTLRRGRHDYVLYDEDSFRSGA